MKLGTKFYNRDAKVVAQDLLGCYLMTDLPEGKAIGKIVETEAYLSIGDLSSHSFRGLTKRNRTMFGPPGYAYVYFTYGMHYCVNVVTREKGVGEAVLIRALEPVEGIDIMKRRRGVMDIKNLCNGPAKLTQSLGINLTHNGYCINCGPIAILPKAEPVEVVTTTRIGIIKSSDLPLRFYIQGNPYISKR